MEEYDDGRKDVFFCLAVNMLPLEHLGKILEESDVASDRMERREKADFVERKMYAAAQELGIELKLRR